MYAEERQQAIAELVAVRGRLSVAELSASHDVTTETIRRDLSALERLGLVRRVHGGAVPADALMNVEFALSERDQSNTAAKERIAAAAVGCLPPSGSSVLLDAGTSTAHLATAIPRDLKLQVYTHAVPISSRLATHPGVDLHVLPGRVRRTTQAAVGSETVAALDRLRVDVAFVGTNALSLAHGLSTPDSDEAATKRAIIAAARRVVVLADASKFGEESVERFATLDQIDLLITDDSLVPDDRGALERAGVEVLIA